MGLVEALQQGSHISQSPGIGDRHIRQVLADNLVAEQEAQSIVAAECKNKSNIIRVAEVGNLGQSLPPAPSSRGGLLKD